MKWLKQTDKRFAESLAEMAADSSLFDPVIEQRAREIIEAVKTRGDAALLELTERFDGARLTAEQMPVSRAEFLQVMLQADKKLRAAIESAGGNVEAFAQNSLRQDWSIQNAQGGKVGEKFNPFQRVGIYIPGGTAPLVSTVLMTVTLARVAGCPEIVVCTPCAKDGTINPGLLLATRMAGATEVYRVGGAQAIAAMALGTATIRPVQKVFGPGNAYVVAAKRLLVGRVAIDLLPGPSELLVIADDSAEPRLIAADVLAQAEHGSGHERVWVASSSGRLLKAVEKEVARQLPARARRGFIEKALAKGAWLIQVKDLEVAAQVANLLAPEHCEIMVRTPKPVAAQIVNAGALFIGPYSPTVLGDYVAGPSHTLPTGGAGRSFAGLTVDQFQRRTSVVEYSSRSLQASVKTIDVFAALEGLEAHGHSATTRFDR